MEISPVKRPPSPQPSAATALLAAAVVADDDAAASDDSDSDSFFDRMAAVAAAKGRGEAEGQEALGKKQAAAAAAAAAGDGRPGGAPAGVSSEEAAAEEQWIEAVLQQAATSSAIKEEADAIWWDDILRMVALSGTGGGGGSDGGGGDSTFGRTDGAYPIDSESKNLLLRKWLAETQGLPRAAPLVRGRPLGSPHGDGVGTWVWHLDNLAQPKAAVGVRRLLGNSAAGHVEVFLHAMETAAATSLLACVLAASARQAGGSSSSITVLNLDPLHEAAVVALLTREGLAPTRRAHQRLYAIPPSQPPPLAPSPLEAEGCRRGEQGPVVSPPKPALKMPRDRGEHCVVLRPLGAHDAAAAAAAAAAGASDSGGSSSSDVLALVGAPGVEALGLWYERELACAVAAEPAAAWIRGLWTSPSYRGRGMERRLIFHLLRQWRAPSAAAVTAAAATAAARARGGGGPPPPGAPTASAAAGGRYPPLIWVDEAEGLLPEDARAQQRVHLHEALEGLGFAPVEGVGGAGVTLECGGGGHAVDAGDGEAMMMGFL